ncbi:MAG: hypothetical protein L3K26_00155 [Candidatus Hydrogenedentes bacterium]|nr:hypothetical protein [Candidatus Hydrogenedentota bacterium]
MLLKYPLRVLSLTLVCVATAFSVSADKFFDTRVYIALEANGQISGELVGESGRSLSRQDICTLALKHLEQEAVNAGISNPKGITRALFEGKFNPDIKDLRLAYDGIEPPKGQAMLNHLNENCPKFVEHLIKSGTITGDIVKKLDKNGNPLRDERKREVIVSATATEVPSSGYLGAVHAEYRNDKWNEMFGSLKSLQNLETKVVIDGEVQTRTMNAQDIGLRAVMRLSTPERFAKNFGIRKDANLTYDAAMKQLSNNPVAKAALKDEIQQSLETQCAFTYFRLQTWDEDSNFNLLRDYNAIRRYYITTKNV